MLITCILADILCRLLDSWKHYIEDLSKHAGMGQYRTSTGPMFPASDQYWPSTGPYRHVYRIHAHKLVGFLQNVIVWLQSYDCNQTITFCRKHARENSRSCDIKFTSMYPHIN